MDLVGEMEISETLQAKMEGAVIPCDHERVNFLFRK
jgi:hypothetical protein